MNHFRWGIFLVLFCSCAVIEAPSGGPEDKIAPGISSVIPASDSTGVSRNSSIVIEFSEKIDGESFKSRIKTFPPLEFKKISAKGNVLELSFREELPETTICLLIQPGFKDDHLVESRKNYRYYFSTTDRILPGNISGKILFKQSPDSMGVAYLVKAEDDTSKDLHKAPEARIAYADAFGNFIFRALPADSSSYRVWAFKDTDGNGKYSFGKEFAMEHPDTLILSQAHTSARNIDINVIDPDEPGSIEGILSDSTGVSGIPSVRLEGVPPLENSYYVKADTLGNYMIYQVKPGAYLFSAFIDVHADSLPGNYPAPDDSNRIIPEPFIMLADTINLSPGEKKVVSPVTIEKVRDEG
ncbi:MAG: Ig-like domain-containing protein [Candidatus Krumholzibacteria bacterium]|nr:Ig-like domain-containing protein [Candidatus Krumholzibacteria bacterium]